MNDTINHYLCTSTTPPNPEYWKNRDDDTWLFRVFPDRVEASTNRDDWLIIVTRPEWFTSTANTVYIRCDEHGNHLPAMPADAAKHHDGESARVDAPLKVGDWVELRSKLGDGCYETRTLQLSKLTWPRIIAVVGDDGYVKLHGYDQWCNQQRFRRVPPPSEQAEIEEEWDAIDATAMSNAEIDAIAAKQDRIAELTTERDAVREQLEHVTRERDALRCRAGSNQSIGVDFGMACGRYYLSVCGHVVAVEGVTQADIQLSRQFGPVWNKEAIDYVVATAKEQDKNLDQAREQLADVTKVLIDSLSITEVGNEFAPPCVDAPAMILPQAVKTAIDTLKLSVEKHELDAEEANKTLATVQAEAAAMRPHVEALRNDLLQEVDPEYGHTEAQRSIISQLNEINACLSGTAGRDLLDEMRRKDERIAELEKRSDEWETWYLDMQDRAKRKCRTAKAELIEARERIAELSRQLAEHAPLVAIALDLRELLTDVDPLDAVADVRIVVKEEEDGEKLMGLLKKLRDAKGGE